MNKTASSLLRKMMRTASEDPAARQGLLPRIARLLKVGGPVPARLSTPTPKAAGVDTAAFAAWAIMRNKVYTEAEVRAVLDRLQVPFSVAAEKTPPKRGPLQVGESVYADKYKNTNEMNTDICARYHLQMGQVEKVEADAVIVRFEDNRLVRFEGGNKAGRDIGLYRGIPATVVEQRPTGRAAIEVVYISDKNAKAPSKTSVEQVLAYVEAGELKGEKRNKSYFSGLCLKQSEGEKGYYFTIFSQQRDRFPRSMNPKLGTLLYVGRLGGRPGGWKAEFDAMLAKAAREEEG